MNRLCFWSNNTAQAQSSNRADKTKFASPTVRSNSKAKISTVYS